MGFLKPCPFCGSVAKMQISKSVGFTDHAMIEWQIGCSKCGVISPKKFNVFVSADKNGEMHLKYFDRDEAISFWNYRADINVEQKIDPDKSCFMCQWHLENHNGPHCVGCAGVMNHPYFEKRG